MTESATTAIFVSVPVAAFRKPQAREYLETLPVPSPATVYGMLLSLVGEGDRRAHVGCDLRYAMLVEPRLSTLIRTTWQVKNRNLPLGEGANRGVDYQELLTDVRVVVWLRQGADEGAAAPLAERVRRVVVDRERPNRFGALCLGESTHLVDEVRPFRVSDGATCRLIRPDPAGPLPLPIWVDHVGSRRTRWLNCRLDEVVTRDVADGWITIRPNDDDPGD